ncbi:MAG: dihydrolipoamide acetyltransferase [Kofleriaceae bacterium]|jgi:hypothetical protein|nr:dihydrolipoamide acetyltransferase [Kofleriaceae bacterium]MBP6838341.1 dihydrolipoamide acetyltransferase [Kofleriaceae bacterium]MBP9208286.1 dihydrolipoamide acetyltransferase [Kofleriaceae bacterium]
MRSSINVRAARGASVGLVVAAVLALLVSIAFAQPTGGGTPATGAGSGSGVTTPTPTPTPTPGEPTAGDPDPTKVDAANQPVPVRLRRLEQRVQALKERAWRAKARVGMLKESALGGGVGAAATLLHSNKMGSSFRLIKLVYAVDGTQVFARSDDSAETLYKTKSFDILNGPIAPGSHTVSVVAVYRGHGYGVFKYLSKYTFQVRASHTFTVEEGKGIKVEGVGYEKGGANTPMEKRSAVEFKVTQIAGK